MERKNYSAVVLSTVHNWDLVNNKAKVINVRRMLLKASRQSPTVCGPSGSNHGYTMLIKADSTALISVTDATKPMFRPATSVVSFRKIKKKKDFSHKKHDDAKDFLVSQQYKEMPVLVRHSEYRYKSNLY